MQKDKFDFLNEEELQKINHEIVPLFGARHRVTSGSYYICKGKKIQCNIAVGDTNTHKSATLLEKIGQKVKEIMGVSEVYSFGIRLA